MGIAGRLSEECRAARRRVGLRTLDIAQSAGVSESTISRFENGVRWPANFEAIIAAYERECGLEQNEVWRRAIDG